MINITNLPPRLKRSEASEYLLARHGISRTAATLAKLACNGGGPAFRKAGGKYVIYDKSELDRWANETIGQPRSSTSSNAVCNDD